MCTPRVLSSLSNRASPLDTQHLSGQVIGLIIGSAVTGIVSWALLLLQNRAAESRQQRELVHNRELQKGEWEQQQKRQQIEWDYQRKLDAARFEQEALISLQEEMHALTGAVLIIDDEKRTVDAAMTPAEREQATEVEMPERYAVNMRIRRDSRVRVRIALARISDREIRALGDRIVKITDDVSVTPPQTLKDYMREGILKYDPAMELVDLQDEINEKIGKRPRLPSVGSLTICWISFLLQDG